MRLFDLHNRRINYLRLSVTDRCNLRCQYCMPAEGVPGCGHDEILRYEELLRISRAAAELGIEKVRVTGGEPLVRKGLFPFLQQLSSIEGINDVALTTNGILLPEMAADIKSTGVRRVNVSLDSLEPDNYREITRGGDLGRALAGLECAEKVGLQLKLNMVVMRGINDHEVEDFAAQSIDRPWAVRFIEYMPTIREKVWRSRVISGAELLGRLRHRFDIEELNTEPLCGPARPYRIHNAKGSLGIITPLSEHFCGSCNRIRVTSKGMAKGCLLSEPETDLRPVLARNSDDELRDALTSVAMAKGPSHLYMAADGSNARFSMSTVGG